ncbi:MAG TPA: type II secretion system F family protein [Lacipirellulaceae bacterium]|nr:type II secretion system F family protein [Lacipirellulaceae bacterium]
MALKLHYGTRGPDTSDPIHDFLSITSWVLVWIGLIPAIIAGAFSFIGLVVVLLAAATLVEVVVQRRAAQRRSVCTLLALYVERRRQITSSNLLSAYTFRGRAGRAAKALFDSLNAGVPLAEAVRENPRALPREAVAYLAATETGRTESEALRELSSGDGGELTTLWRSCVDRISYLGCVLLVTLVVFTFLMIKILPAYVDIFREFDMDLPPITQLAVATSNFFLHYLAIPVFLVLLVVVVCGFVIGICYLCDIYVLRTWGDRFLRSRRNADVLRILAIAAGQQQPLASALDRIARAYPSRPIRRQLLPAAEAVNAGSVWQDALSANRIISTAEASLLKSAEQTKSIPWTLRQVAARREKRAVYRLASALQILYPVAIVLIGAMIGFYVISLFIPLVRLIQGMAV